jgi:undecaprenyl-diphosphatase
MLLLLVVIAGRYLLTLEFIVLGLGLFIPRFRFWALGAWLSAALAAIIGWLIKDFFYLPRPFILSGRDPVLPYLLDGTFPSNHVAAATALGVSLFLVNRRRGLLFLLLAGFIAAGRVAGGVHTFIDVFSGAALGCVCALVIYQVLGIDSCHS